MKVGDISQDAVRVTYAYRGKGGKAGRRELLLPAFEAIQTWLTAIGRDLEAMAPDES